VTDLFVTHYAKQNQIAPEEATVSLIIVFVLLLAASVFSFEKKSNETDTSLLGIETGVSLRGIAILLLIFGHLTFHCIRHKYFFEDAGTWAVIMFLFISGIAVSKTYGIKNIDNYFLLKRLKRLFVPTWLSVITFYFLDFILRGSHYSFKKVLFSFSGVFTPGPPNDSMWFVTYILFFYGFYFIVSKIKTKPVIKVLVMTAGSCIISLAILKLKPLISFRIWVHYSFVFPISVLIGIYAKGIKDFLKKMPIPPLLFWIATFALLYFYASGAGLNRLKALSNSFIPYPLVKSLHPVSFAMALTILVFLMDSFSFRSRFLQWTGKHSFEIYLVHLPFMLYYDFLLFRKPLFVFLIIYLILIFSLSYFLKLVSGRINQLLFRRLIPSDKI